MTTLGTMITRIADEMADSTIDAQIFKAIVSAAEYYETIRWHQNEAQHSWTVSSGQEYYDPLTEAAPVMTKLPADIDTLRITVNGSNNYLLQRRDWGWMDKVQTNSNHTGDPTSWCWYKNQIRLWPIPNDTTSIVKMSAVVPPDINKEVSLSSTTSVSNVWTNEFERLIRYRAKADLYANIRRQDNEAQKFSQMESAEYRKLRYDNANYTSKGRMTATTF